MVKIIYDHIPKGTKRRPGNKMKPLYITIHNTANREKGADALAHVKNCKNHPNVATSFHYAVDDRSIYELIPCSENAWHAGDGSKGTGNKKSIAIEICENSDGDLLKATDNAVELTRHLMEEYNIPISRVVQHNKWSGKDCPNRLRRSQPYSWETFLEKVKGGSGAFKSYLVKITCDELNIRKTPEWGSSDVVGVVHKGEVFTIVGETKLNGTVFGKLKSGAGWISVHPSYVKKI